MGVERIIPYPSGSDLAMEDPVLCLRSPANPAEAVRRGLRVVYPLINEPWGVRRFFVEDPDGTIVNVLAHAR